MPKLATTRREPFRGSGRGQPVRVTIYEFQKQITVVVMATHFTVDDQTWVLRLWHGHSVVGYFADTMWDAFYADAEAASNPTLAELNRRTLAMDSSAATSRLAHSPAEDHLPPLRASDVGHD